MNKNKAEKCNTEHLKISEHIKDFDNKYKKLNMLYENKNEHYRYLKKKKNPTKYCYVTIIFCDAKYLSGILVVGNYLKNIIKTKYDIVCLVQDKPYYEKDLTSNHYLKFKGLNNSEINDIKKIYDVVIGIDLVKSNVDVRTDWELLSKYSKLPYYCTKLMVLGLTQYKKCIYMDSSVLIINNLDYLFDLYDKSTYRYNYTFPNVKRGLLGNFYLFIPKKYYLYKGLYLTSNYSNIFKNSESCFKKDEDIIFYSVYPNWNDKYIDQNLFKDNYQKNPYIESKEKKYQYSIELYMGFKPFLYPSGNEVIERNKFNINYNCFYHWDISAKYILNNYENMNKYFDFIKTFRYVSF